MQPVDILAALCVLLLAQNVVVVMVFSRRQRELEEKAFIEQSERRTLADMAEKDHGVRLKRMQQRVIKNISDPRPSVLQSEDEFGSYIPPNSQRMPEASSN